MRQTWGRVLGAALILAGFVVSIMPPLDASAAQITTRSLELIGVGTVGGAQAGGTVNHKFTFTIPTNGTLGSIKFEYCTIARLETCVTPENMNASGASFGSEAGSAVTGFSMGAKTANSFVLTRSAASTGSPNTTAVLQANNVVNPDPAGDNDNYTFFVRISTYASTDASGAPVDEGSVAASTTNAIQLTGTMPESLIFCTGETITATAGIPDCTTATAGDITFNQLFSPTDTSVAKSQMAASTNAGSGYVISVNGTTLTSGSNTIPAIAAAGGAASIKGTGQFGMNLRANTTAAAQGFDIAGSSADIDPVSTGTDLRGQAVGDYATPDNFKFVSGETIADSAFSVAGPTNAQIYTASYIVNVSGNQLAGTYNTTLTYICTPTF
jgi:hypothetical protein